MKYIETAESGMESVTAKLMAMKELAEAADRGQIVADQLHTGRRRKSGRDRPGDVGCGTGILSIIAAKLL